MSEVISVQQQIPSLSVKALYNNFFLLHDFFHKITKIKATNSQFFDLQIQIYTGMTKAVNTGSKVSQALAFGSLFWYFIRGNSIKLRFVYGFLFMYWYNHIITLGSYAGVFFKMPSVYKRTNQYFLEHPQQKNLIKGIDKYLQNSESYEEPQFVLSEIFQSDIQQKSYVTNDFFIKNKEKYLPKDITQRNIQNSKKLTYFDSFLTRYIYYSFTRWWSRMGQFLSLESNQQ